MQKYKIRYRDYGKIHVEAFYARNLYDAEVKAQTIMAQNYVTCAWLITSTDRYIPLYR